MKITKKQLRTIIKEEKARLDEAPSTTAVDRLNSALDGYVSSYLRRAPGPIIDALDSLRDEVEGYIEFRTTRGRSPTMRFRTGDEDSEL
jgi:tRNA U34 2-thiouridine synthase MnmA/TrmU